MSELTIDPAGYAAIDLAKGSHDTPGQGMCLMEATAFLAGERHTDNPKCVSPVLGAFGRNLNDVLSDDIRQDLKHLIPLLPGTANDGWDEKRSYMALDWLVRAWLPAMLELNLACHESAHRVRSLDRIVDLAAARRADMVVRDAQKCAAAAAAGSRPAAWDAARAVIRDTGWYAARDAASTLAWDATGAVAGVMARTAHAAIAGADSGNELDTTVRDLQLSLIDLYVRVTQPQSTSPASSARTDRRCVSCARAATRRRGQHKRLAAITRTPRVVASRRRGRPRV